MIDTQLTNQNLLREWRNTYWKFQPLRVKHIYKLWKIRGGGGIHPSSLCTPLVRPKVYFFLVSWGALFRPSKIAKPTVFQAVLRGIGKSFQSAITAPRMNLTGYGNATAQSWLSTIGIQFSLKTSLSSMWDVTNMSIPLLASAHVYNHFRCSLLCGKVVIHWKRWPLLICIRIHLRTYFVNDSFQCVWQLRLVQVKIKWIIRNEELSALFTWMKNMRQMWRWLPWVSNVFLARFPLSVMSVLWPALSVAPPSFGRPPRARKNLWYPG